MRRGGKDFSRSGLKTFLTYAGAVMLPSVVLNSAAWGQCDSVYVVFCVLCFWLLGRKKYTAAFLSCGMAFAFKLQAIFLMPFLILCYLKERKFSLLNFLLIPAVMILSGLGGILAGRSVLAPFQIYLEQTGYYASLSMNYPSVWALLTANDAPEVFSLSSGFCITAAMTVILTELLMLLKSRNSFSGTRTLFAAFLMSYSCVLFLPDMHERYSFLYVILGLMLAVLEPRTWISFVFLILLDLQTYGAFLFDPARYPSGVPCASNPVQYPMMNLLSLINILCFLSYVLFWGKRFFPPESGGGTPGIPAGGENLPQEVK